MSEQHGLVPYDLQMPARMLVPYPHKRRNFRARTVTLGQHGAGENAELEIWTWDACAPGCDAPVPSHDAGRSVRLQVPCENLPHCHYCECGSKHEFLLADGQVSELLAALS